MPSPRFREDKGNQDVFSIVGVAPVYVFRWENGQVKGWIQIEADGEKKDLGEEFQLMSQMFGENIEKEDVAGESAWLSGKVVIWSKFDNVIVDKTELNNDSPNETEAAGGSVFVHLQLEKHFRCKSDREKGTGVTHASQQFSIRIRDMERYHNCVWRSSGDVVDPRQNHEVRRWLELVFVQPSK